MVVQEMFLVKREWRLLPMENLQLTCALRISFAKVYIVKRVRLLICVGTPAGAYRTVELDVDIGSSAFDYAALQKSEVFRVPRSF